MAHLKSFRTGLAGSGMILAATAVMTGAGLADVADDIGLTWTARINDAQTVAEVDSLIGEIMTDVAANDGVLVYELGRVGDMLYGYERFDNEAALFAHLKVIEPHFPAIVEAWTPVTIVPTTPLPGAVAEVFANFGVLVPDQTFTLDR